MVGAMSRSAPIVSEGRGSESASAWRRAWHSDSRRLTSVGSGDCTAGHEESGGTPNFAEATYWSSMLAGRDPRSGTPKPRPPADAATEPKANARRNAVVDVGTAHERQRDGVMCAVIPDEESAVGRLGIANDDLDGRVVGSKVAGASFAGGKHYPRRRWARTTTTPRPCSTFISTLNRHRTRAVHQALSSLA